VENTKDGILEEIYWIFIEILIIVKSSFN